MSRQFSEKEAIKNLQTYLRAQAIVNPDAIIPPVDGIFDTQTQNALIDFQLRSSLEPTGVADKITFELLYAQYLDILEGASLPNPIIPFPSYPKNYAIKRGDNGFLTEVLQYMLNEIGLIYNVFEAIEINGEYDEATERAVSSFQKINGLSPSGSTDRATWNSLARIYNLSTHHIDIN